MASSYTIGLDYGTNSARAVVVDCADGRELGTRVFGYPSGERGIIVDPRDPHLARQHPADYLEALREATLGALTEAEKDASFSRDRVIGIGVDTTGSTPMPADASAEPLALKPEWADEPAAMAWLWKDHTGAEEAAAITSIAEEHAPEYLEPIGGTYSSEWFWSKVWHCLNVAPDVFEAADTWIELVDYIPAVLIGVDDAREIPRGVCAAGHKAMYSP
ncbi:MAG: FGGY family carbohydrate kinase, partial [Gemmatimonadota bacterium]